jgi:alanine dehydrogenase
MKIGVPKEIKNHEYRVGITPDGVSELTQRGHSLFVESDAGSKIGFSNADYEAAGAIILPTAAEVYQNDMIVKVKEPQPVEIGYLNESQILFTYLHLAPDPALTKGLLDSKVVGVAYETVKDANNNLPLLTPMSEVAGRIAIQAGATALQMASGGRGVLLGGVPGVTSAEVAIIGGGIVGTQAAKMAQGLGARVKILDISMDRLRYLDDIFQGSISTEFASKSAVQAAIERSDLVVGAVLIPGKQAPKLLTAAQIKTMKSGSVFVDVAIDQGGCSETSRATTHSDPTYIVDDVVHYCVANMPGACARTSTLALTNVTLPYVKKLADNGLTTALSEDPGLLNGLNLYKGKITNEHVANDLGYEFHQPGDVLGLTNQVIEANTIAAAV